MKYIKSEVLDELKDCTIIYVHRDILNKTIAGYELNVEENNCMEELKTLLEIWNDIYKLEKETRRIRTFIGMKNNEVKRCFKKYKSFPIGSFAIDDD